MQKTKDTYQPPNVHIGVENFGPIEKAEIDLRPLTVFVGESNTGKTYLAALIYAGHKIFDGFSRIPYSYRTGYLLDSLYDHLQEYSPEFQDKLDIEILEVLEKLNTSGRSFKFSDLPYSIREALASDLKRPNRFAYELQRCFDLKSVSNLIRVTGGAPNELKISLKVHEENRPLWSVDIHGSESDFTVAGSVNTDLVILSQSPKTLRKTLDIEEGFRLLRSSVSERRVGNAYYLPAARSGIMQTHSIIMNALVDQATGIGLVPSPEIPTFSGMIADFLKHVINYDERRAVLDEIQGIALLLENEVLRGEIAVKKPAGTGYPQFLYRPQNADEEFRMSRASSMVSELGPLVFFLRGIVQPGDTLIIEEPESHLHPAAQTKVALTLGRLVRSGVRVIITTHSDWLLEQISNLVREGEVMKLGKNKREPTTWLTKEEVGAWWFRTDKPVKEIPFDCIEGIEPKDYYNVAEELHNNAVEFQQHLLNEEEFGDDA